MKCVSVWTHSVVSGGIHNSFFLKSEMGNSLLMKETPETSFGVGCATQGVLAELRNPLYSATLQGEGSILRLYKLFCGQLQHPTGVQPKGVQIPASLVLIASTSHCDQGTE